MSKISQFILKGNTKKKVAYFQNNICKAFLNVKNNIK